MRYFDIFDNEEKEIGILPPRFVDDTLGDTISIENRVVIPSFIDAHAHILGSIVKSNWVNLFDIKSKQHLFDLIKEYSDRNKKVFIGYNFDESKWSDDKSYPTRKELDAVSKDLNIFLMRIDGHLAVVNSKTIETFRIPKDVFYDFSNGIITEDYVYDIANKILKKYGQDLKEQTILEFIKKGVLAACDMGLDLSVPKTFIKKIKNHIDLYEYTILKSLEKVHESDIKKVLEKYGAKPQGIKLFVDGSIGARTAFLFEPYRDDPNNRGLLLISEELLETIVKICNKLKIQLAIHAIGDAAIDITLRALKHADIDLRHRIEHLEMPLEDHVKKLSSYGIIPSMQPNFVANWQQRGGLYERRLGWDRAKNMNPFRTILEKRKILSFGSDCMPLDPLYGLYGAMTHPIEEEKLSFTDAVLSYTHGSAYSIFMENVLGKIAPGYDASFLILNIDQNPSPDEVKKAKIVFICRRGNILFNMLPKI